MTDSKNKTRPENKNRLKGLAVAHRRRRVPGPGYTRLVKTLRLALPLAALALVTVLFSWPQIVRQRIPATPQAALPQTIGRNELINPHFESADSQNNPFTVTAERAVQSTDDPNFIVLEAPSGSMALKDNAHVTVQARQGGYRQEAQNLSLEGDVRLSHSDGYEIGTAKILLDLKTHQAWSDQPVRGAGPMGTLEASGLRFEGDSGLLVFTGPARLVLNRAVKGL